MAIALSILAAIFGYSTSKYFPKDVPLISEFSFNMLVKKSISGIFYSISLVLFIVEYGSGTGTLVWVFVITLTLSTLILSLPYKPRFVYFFLVIGFLFLVIDTINYAS